MIFKQLNYPEGLSEEGVVPATLHYHTPVDAVLKPIEEPVFTLQDMLDAFDAGESYISNHGCDNNNRGAEQYFKDKHGIDIDNLK